MKYWFTRFLAVLAFFSVTLATNTYNFKAESSEGKVILKWNSGDESNLVKYIIDRRTSETSYPPVESDVGYKTVDPQRGNYNNYEIEDIVSLKSSNFTFYYRLKIIDKNSRATMPEVSASPTLSVPTRTWGSIKAMFR